MASLKQGDSAPVFKRTAHNGDTVDLAACRGDTSVVVYFYPRDETPVCTRQACSFRDHHARLADTGALVVGVSADDDASHRRFAEHHGLNYPLIADTDGRLRAAFGVPKTLGVMAGRTTFVIDRDGVVRLKYSAQFAAAKHVEAALAVLRDA